jgi:hypothetical protein
MKLLMIVFIQKRFYFYKKSKYNDLPQKEVIKEELSQSVELFVSLFEVQSISLQYSILIYI